MAHEDWTGGFQMEKSIALGLGLPLALLFCAQTDAQRAWTSAAPPTPALFAPGVVARTDTEESMLTVAPGGSEVFWGVSRKWFPMSRVSEVWTALQMSGRWRAARAPFSTGFSDADPFVTYSGKQIFFASVRPVGSPRKDFDLYVIERTAGGYGRARNLGMEINSSEDELYPSVSGDGTIYFGSDRSGAWKIYRSKQLDNGSYSKAEALPSPVNQDGVWSFNPFVTEDGQTLIFTSLNRAGGVGKGDIWVAKRGGTRDFDEARNLGPTVNTAEEEFHPTLSPDQGALFFVRRNTSATNGNADIYWVRAKGLL